jgi:hypothetical protein
MYVATSKTLLGAIENRIEHLSRTEQKSLAPPVAPAMKLVDQPWLRKITWGVLFGSEFEMHPSLRGRSPKTVRLHITELDALLPGRKPDEVDLGFSVEDTAQYFYEYQTHQVSREAHPYLGEWADNHLVRMECINRWLGIGKKVRLFLDNCKSLNEALKLWPDLAHYVPKEYLDKVNAKTEAKKSGPSEAALAALKAIDTDVVAQSNVLARMAGAPGVAGSGA